MKPDLKGNPFYLTDEQINWVNETRDSLSREEKVGQLFCPISMSADESYLRNELLRFHVGGLLFKTSPAKEVRAAQYFMQANSKVPLLCAANLEFGSTGYLENGTMFAQQMAIGATGDTEQAYKMGYVSCKEAAAVGCNFAFAPVSDLDFNWRNPIINVRSYGSDPDKVLAMCKAYKRGADENNVAVSVKHFPGDGVDEVDQHLLVSVNTLDCGAWDASYGKVYRGLIADGAKTFMIGHIDLPAWRRRLNPKLPKGTVPATLSPELMDGLLRKELGFNGLIITDATPMVGYTSAMKRADAVPTTIAAGADMFLFNKDLAEDYGYMLGGIERGILGEDRLDEAVTRILALKASLGLAGRTADDIIPCESAMECIGCKAHHYWARECADKAITLVKDTQNALPLSPKKTPRLLLEVLGGCPSEARISAYMAKKLEREGFAVTIYHQEDFSTYRFGVKPFTDAFDAVMYLGNIENASNKTTNRINWYTFWGHGNNVPWFVHEVPTVFVSLANPYHLVDVPMIPTYINCYTNNEETLDSLVEKLMGRDGFTGVSPVDAFCGKDYLQY
ncbi:MAG: glycoside hydrolase family 3 N-terminal domain-containing protein [Eubacteriales bacterium]|nr:glycoside hydrolase family 3 N-terminal domain-containing protein [Eubacteriales bacterium]MDD3883001.1 glycoside hydrolase family 3 N-terminal domain-containing protein [Eubacteriales bacterium]MDD4513451.1 glycoside hydrolase family 3 N-terminal domain-containing protein [Eubacteriales bacterium]